MVGPFPPTVGGITTCIMGILASDLKNKFNFVPLNTSRPTVGLVKEVYDYTIVSHLGVLHLVKAALATFCHLTRFPIVMIVNNPRLVHIHTTDYLPFWESSIYVFLAKIFSNRVIVHIHSTSFIRFYESSNLILKFLIRETLNMADRTIILSPRWKSFFLRLVPENKLVVLPNSAKVRILSIQPEERTTAQRVVKVLFVGGEEAKRKGLYVLLKAIPIVLSRSKNVLFLFVGRSNTRKLRNLCNKQQINGFVEVLGYVEDDRMTELLMSSDIYILPSFAEGLPIAMLEAMAAGLPIISTLVGSIPDVIEENVNGFLVEPGNYDALAAKIVQLMHDEGLRQRMGRNNIEKIRRQYSTQKTMERLEKVYRQIG